MRRSGRLLAGILVLALSLRLGYVVLAVGASAPPEYDGVDYDLLARNLLASKGYALYSGPTAFRPPGYPLFLAGLYAAGEGSLAILRGLQAVLGAATCAVAYRIARLLFSRRAALLAALLVAVHPVLLYLCGIVYPELLVSLLLSLAV